MRSLLISRELECIAAGAPRILLEIELETISFWSYEIQETHWCQMHCSYPLSKQIANHTRIRTTREDCMTEHKLIGR